MGRTPLHTDQKLLNAGAALARRKGLSGFSVRELCAKSRVNLGMFHYHFKTKERFDRELLRALYGELMSDISIDICQTLSPRQNTGHILKSIYGFARKNRVLLSALLADIMSGDKHTLAFVVKHFTQHVSLLLQELRRARLTPQARALPAPSLAITLVLPAVLPQIFSGTLERLGQNLLPPQARKTVRNIWSEEETRKRVELLLNAVFSEDK